MKKIGLLLLVSLFFGHLSAQVVFRNLTLEEALEVAEKEGKLVFVDFTAPWCCGCKLIESELKNAKEFGEVMNKLCVCIQADVDTKYGRELREKYIVPSLPTYLFLRPDGTLQHQFGSGTMIEFFVKKFWRAVDPYRCYSYYKSQYDAGNREVSFLADYIECLDEMGWEQMRDQVKEELWSRCSDQNKMTYFSLFFDTVLEEESKEMQFLIANQDECRKRFNATRVDEILGTPIKNLMMKVIRQDTVLSKNQLNEWKKKAIQRGVMSEEMDFFFEITSSICSGSVGKVYSVCLKGIEKVKDERQRFSILSLLAEQAKEKKEIQICIEIGEKCLPLAVDHNWLGTKKQIIQKIETLKKKL